MRLWVGYHSSTIVPHQTNCQAWGSMRLRVRSNTSRIYIKSLLATSVFITAPSLSQLSIALLSLIPVYSL